MLSLMFDVRIFRPPHVYLSLTWLTSGCAVLLSDWRLRMPGPKSALFVFQHV